MVPAALRTRDRHTGSVAEATPQDDVTGRLPHEVDLAFRLWRAGIAAAVLSSVASLLILDELVAIRGRVLPPDVDPVHADTYLLIGGVVGALLAAGAGAVGLLCAVRMRAGRNWARVVLAVLGAAVVGYGVLTAGETFALFAAGPVGGLVALLTLASLGATAAAILFMFRPGVAGHFR